nr:hypothetical protein [Clostridiales bacterium]
MTLPKSLSLILAAILAAACVFTACGEASESPSAPSATASPAETAAETEPPSELELRAQISDDLPEADFGGYEFRVVI